MELKDENGNFNAALLDYVRRGRVELMEALLRNDNRDLNDLEGRTLLHHAAESNIVSMTRLFINNNHDVDVVDNRGNSPLMLAAKNRSYDTAKLLVEAGANIYLRSEEATNILSYEAKFNSRYPAANDYLEFGKAILQKLRKDCANDEQLLLTRLRDFGCSFFHVVTFQDAYVTRLMLKNGYLVDERDTEIGYTPLHEAVSFGYVEIVNVLLEFGADVNACDESGLTPIYYLHEQLCDDEDDIDEKLEILKILIEHGALSFRRPDDDEYRKTPSDNIMRYGGLRAINVLMQYDVDFNSYDALFSLIYNSNRDTLEVLRGKSIDVNTQNPSGSSVLWFAVSCGYLKKIEFLLEHGADPNAVDRHGRTELIAAIMDLNSWNLDVHETHLAKIRLLLQYGADAQYAWTPAQLTVFDLWNHDGKLLEPVIAHLAMKESCGVAISELIRRKIDSDDFYKQHFQVCKGQIDEMKETTINGSVTLYKLLTGSHLKITRYARDPAFSPKFEEAMRVKRILDPYYSVSLQNRVGKAIQEAKLKKEAVVVLDEIFPCRFRNYPEIFGEIVDYLTCDDLKNICKIYDLESSNLPT